MIKVFFVDNEIRIGQNKEVFKADNWKTNESYFYAFCEEFEKIIQGLYIYDGLDMYNFGRGTIVEKIREISFRVNILIQLQEVTNGEKIEIVTDDEMFRSIAQTEFNMKSILINGDYEVKKRKSIDLQVIINILKSVKDFLIYSKKGKKQNLLLVTNKVGINCININSEKKYYDSYYGKVYEDIREKYNVLEVKYDRIKGIKRKNLSKKYISYDFLVVMKKLFKKIYFNEGKVSKKLDVLYTEEFKYRGINLNKTLDEYIFRNLEKIYISYIFEMENASHIMEKKNIKKIMVIDEADRFRCFVVAANRNNIKSFAVQHGHLTKASYSYSIPAEDSIYVPYKTFLWGAAFKDELIRNTKVYNDKNLVVVGQPRTDIMFDLLKTNTKKSKEKIKIVYATQPVNEIKNKATQIICEALKDMDSYELLIKLHPSESATDYYEELVEKYNLKNVKIVKDKDIYECILWCDLVISVHSTVVLEAAILNKPSICILLPNYYDEAGFVRDGIAVGAESYKELQEKINMLLKKSNISRDYIKNYFYKIDGLVHKRIMEEVTYE